MTHLKKANKICSRSSKSSKTPPTTPPIGGKSSPSTRSISPHPKSSTSLVLVPSNHVPEKEKKRKEPSNSRQKKFHRHFEKVPKEERVLNCEYKFYELLLSWGACVVLFLFVPSILFHWLFFFLLEFWTWWKCDVIWNLWRLNCTKSKYYFESNGCFLSISFLINDFDNTPYQTERNNYRKALI